MIKGKAVKAMTIGAFILGATLPRVVAQDEPVYYLNGDAVVTGEDCYQLTPAINTQNGSVWYADQVDLNQPLDLQFTLNLGTDDSGGADGICFVLQTVGTDALGESGGGLGFLGTDFQPAFAVEFDTWQNGNYGDPAGDHIAMVSNGSVDHNAATAIAGPVQADAFDDNIEDGEDHEGRVTWDPDAQIVRVYFDCELRLEGFVDLVDDIFFGQNQVYFGFTASTGGADNVQTVCLSANILGSAEQSYICPGAEVQLNVPSPDGTATWSPADYLSDATVSSPICIPPEGLTEPLVYTVTYTDQCGIDVIDTLQLTVEEMVANVVGLSDITCLSDEVGVIGTSNFPGPLEFLWFGPQGAVSANNALATISQPGDFTLVVEYEDGLCTAEQEFTVAVDTVSFTGVFPETGYLTCDESTFPLAAESLSDASASVSWSTTGGTIQGGGPAVTATETGLYNATVTNPANGCITEADVEVVAADAAPVLSGGFVEPLTCLTPNQPVIGLTIGDYAPFGTGNLTPVVSWINAENGTTMGVSPATGSIGPIIDAAGTYEVTVEWQETGCSSSLTVDAVEGEDFGVDISSLTFPNILTANNDGKNDSWYPFLADLPDVEALSVLTNYALRVYNRWGQVVYTNAGNGFASGTPIRWYGNGNGGDPLSAGAYYYVVDYTSTCGDSQSGSAEGMLEIIRE